MNSRILLDSNFMHNVINNQGFHENGFYSGKDSGINFTIIDPKIHDIKVWVKQKNFDLVSALKKLPNHKYRTATKSLGVFVFTNGPFMTPGGPINLINSIASVVTFIPCKIASFFGYSSFPKNWGLYAAYVIPYWPWKSFGTVHQGVVLDDIVPKSLPPNSSWFGRIRTGSFEAYTIQNGVPDGAIEGIIGHPIIKHGKIINPTKTSWAARASAICCWGLIPYSIHPIGKISKSSTNDEKSVVILVMGSNANTSSIPQKMVDVGVVDAIGMDGGTSALMGEGENIFFECKWYKDKIQKYGLFCS